MTVQFALFLSPDGIALAHRQNAGHWAFLGDVGFASATLDDDMAKLRAKGEARAGEDFATLLVLPDDQILYTSLTAPTQDPELTAYRVEEGLEGLTPYTVSELAYDWREIEEDRVKLAVVARETLEEARAFAEGHGFNGVGFAAMPPLEKFPGVPLFDLSGPAVGLSFPDEGLAFGADAWDDTAAAQPHAEPANEPPPEAPTTGAVPEAAPEEAALPEEIAAERAVEDAVSVDPAPAPAAPAVTSAPAGMDIPDFAVPDTAEPEVAAPDTAAPDTAEQDTGAEDAEDTEEETPPSPISDPMLDGPVAPLPAEAESPLDPADDVAPETAPATPVLDDLGEIGDDDLPPAPSAAVLAARNRGAKAGAASQSAEAAEHVAPPAEADAPAPDTQAPAFSARRGKAGPRPLDDPETDTTGDLVGQRKSRIGFGATRSPATGPTEAEGETDTALSSATPKARAPIAKPKLPSSGQPEAELTNRLTRLRDASRSQSAKPATPAKGTRVAPSQEEGTPRPKPDRAKSKPSASPAKPGRAASKQSGPAASGATGRLTGMLASARESISAKPSDAEGTPPRTSRMSGLIGAAKQGALGRGKGPSSGAKGDQSSEAKPMRIRDRLTSRRDAPTPVIDGGGSQLSALGAALSNGDTPQGTSGSAAAATPTSAPKVARISASADKKAAARTDADGAFASGLLARKSDDSATAPSFRTGLILTVALLILLALIAIWSVLFLPDSPVARLFSGNGDAVTTLSDDPLTAPAPPAAITAPPAIGQMDPSAAPTVTAPQIAPETTPVERPADAAPQTPDAADEGVALAALPATSNPDLQDAATARPEAAAVELPDIDAELDLPPLPPTPEDLLPSIEEAEQIYADDGIWPRTPARPDPGQLVGLNDLYVASIDPAISTFDAVALPAPGVNPGEVLRRIPSPPPFGAEIETDARGLIAPTPEGVVTPDGAFVILGRPDIVAVPRPRELAPAVETPDTGVEEAILGTFSPAPRPTDLDETRERQVLGGLTLGELSDLRPPARPLSAQEAAAQASLFPGGDADGPAEAEAAALADAAEAEAQSQDPEIVGTALAVASSRVPPTRPANIAELVANAQRAAPVAAIAPSQIAPQPQIPTSADVARAATERDALRLRDLNLIGVTGTNSSRRALVRLPSGRFVRVAVGDSLNGGTVAAIGESTLQYVRNGRTVTLEVPG